MEIKQSGLVGTVNLNDTGVVSGMNEIDKSEFLEKLHALMEGYGVVKIDVAFNPFAMGVFVGKK